MRAKINIGGAEVELVGSPTEVATVLSEVLGSQGGQPPALPAEVGRSPRQATSEGEASTESVPAVTPHGKGRITDAKSFFEDRGPANNREATAVAVYYATHVASSEVSGGVTAEALGDIFRQAQWKLPRRLDQTLVDTQGVGYLNRVERGTYELSNTGYNLVVHTLGSND